MSLDISKLENVRTHGEKITARCPACAEADHDQTRNHLIIQADGRFGCVVYPGESAEARAHRKRIFALCGDREIKPLIVHGSQFHHPPFPSRSKQKGVLSVLIGRLGRQNSTSMREATHTKNNDLQTEKSARIYDSVVPSVPIEPANDDVDVLFSHLHIDIEAPPDPAAAFSNLRESEIVPLLKQAAELGLKLGWEGPATLTVRPADRCPAEFVATLRKHKPSLLALLRLRFVMVRSAVLNETVFFAANEATKTALVHAGAEPGCIYTCEELRLLVEQHRREPITAAELLKIHATKRIFNARIAE